MGGLADNLYYAVENDMLHQFFILYSRCNNKHEMQIPSERLPIAYLELLTTLMALTCFAIHHSWTLIRLNTDNTDVVAWLRKGRCRAGIVFRILSAIEFLKKRHNIKLCPKHIKGANNCSADKLSRGKIPRWLSEHDRIYPDIRQVFELVSAPLKFWQNL